MTSTTGDGDADPDPAHARAPSAGSVPESLRVPRLEDLGDVSNKRVLVRCDFNVPLRRTSAEVYEVVDDFRIRAALPTIAWLVDHGAQVTTCSHLGRPHGVADPQWTMEPVRRRLAELAPGVELMDNLRFDPGEESNDPAFVERLIEGQDLYVNDAFGVSHRSHASIIGPPEFLRSAAGRLLEREIAAFGALLGHPHRPFTAVVGGAKVAEKIGLLAALSRRVESLIIGGGMVFTFLATLGHEIGESLFEADQVDACKALLDSGRRILLPTDVVALGPGGVIGPDREASSGEVRVVGRDIPDGWRGLDIGPGSAAAYAAEIADAATVFWNGPMGVFEDERFAPGTETVARAVAGCSGFTVAGGGETVSAIDHWGLERDISFVSTGGGAAMDLIEGGDLPGIAALRHGARWGQA